MSDTKREGMVRITASLSKSQEAALKALSSEHKVSVAWLIRLAVEELVERRHETQHPLDLVKQGEA